MHTTRSTSCTPSALGFPTRPTWLQPARSAPAVRNMSACAQSIAQQLCLMCLGCTQQVADFLGTIHHEFTFTVQEGLDALEDLIWHIESFEQVQHRTRTASKYEAALVEADGHTRHCYQQHVQQTRNECRQNTQSLGMAGRQDLSSDSTLTPQVRAAVPMYILTRKIKAMGIKVVLSGEGADEALGGYLFFHKAPDAAEFHM
jgi:Asparagine synthase